MASQVLLEGEILQDADGNDPDLNAAFYNFIDQVKSEANSGGSIAVFQVPVDANGNARPNTLNKPKLFTVPVGSCTFDDICDRVLREFVEPGGSILIQLLGRKDGKRGNLLNQLIPLRRGKTKEEKSDGSTAGDIERLMRLMDERISRSNAETRELLAQAFNNRPTVDPLTQALAISEKITAMSIAARGGQVAGAVGSPTDPNNIMNQMMAMMMTTMMKKFMSGMDGSEKKEENNSWLKDIAELAKPLLEAKAVAEKTNLVREQRMLAHERTNAAPPQTTEKIKPAPGGKEENDMKLLALLNEALPMLIDQVVKNDGDPVATANLLMDGIPEDDAGLNDALYSMLQSPPAEFLAKLGLADKRALEHAEWFEKLRVALLESFDPDIRVPAASAPA